MPFNLDASLHHFGLDGLRQRPGPPIYRAALATTPACQVDADSDTLRIKSRCFNGVALLLFSRTTTSPRWYEAIAGPFITPLYTGEPVEEAIRRTTVANPAFDGERAPASFGADYARMKTAGTFLVSIFCFMLLLVATLGIWVAIFTLRRFSSLHF